MNVNIVGVRTEGALMKEIGDVATRTRRAVVRCRLLDLCEHATGEDRSALRLAADVLQVLDEHESE